MQMLSYISVNDLRLTECDLATEGLTLLKQWELSQNSTLIQVTPISALDRIFHTSKDLLIT